jgi:phosphoribosylanthranilate isomerase
MKMQISPVRIKICGITNKADALFAAELGADAIGFVFAPSPRQVSPEKAKSISTALPPFIQTVGVFVDESAEEVLATADFCRLDVLQFHGKESIDYCARHVRRVIKGIRVKDENQLKTCSEYSGAVDAILLDTHVSGQSGGTGRTFDWNLAKRAGQYGRIILAGGLHAGNVADAIHLAGPYGVDASSCLEKEPGVKDHDKMARFVRAVHNAETEQGVTQ